MKDEKAIDEKSLEQVSGPDHDTSLTFVKAQKAIVLSPGLLNDHHPEFRWIPFDCEETIPCILCTHSEDKRKTINKLTEQIISFYSNPDLIV